MAKAHLFKPGEAMTAETMNTLLQDSQIATDVGGENPSDSKIMSQKAVSDLVKQVEKKIDTITSSSNDMDVGDANGQKDNVSITIKLPKADELLNNKYIAFLYYGRDMKRGDTEKGLQLLRAFVAHSAKGSTDWEISDTESHSWLAFCYNDTANGWVQSTIENNTLKFEMQTFDDFKSNDERFFVQGWQLI